MIHKIAKITTCTFLCILLASCITSVDTSLPYDRLSEITVASEINLVAAPSHPTAYLQSKPIPAGEKVQVIGTDSDAAWLLVLYKDMLGWMPTFYSRTNVGLLKSAIVVDPAPGKCSKYLGAISAPDEPWVNKAGDAAFVIGSVYRSKTEAPFEEATLALEITGGGTVVDADYMYTPLTPSKAIVLFGFSVVGLQKESQLLFNLANSSSEALAFQAAFFTNDCPEALNQLNIGKLRVPAANEAVASARNEAIQSQQTPIATLTPVQKESGPSKPEPTATPTLNPTRAAMTANMQLIYQNDFEGVINAEWSKTQRNVAPSGEGFLGQFGSDVVTLRLTDLPEHNSIGLSFDLYIIRSWDGINTTNGPDIWGINVADGTTLLHTTFSNGDPLQNARQAYPYPYPGSNQPARTGAVKINSLGYDFRGTKADTTYAMTFDFPHSASTLELRFYGSGLQGLDDESWGIDNVEIYIRN